MGVPVTVRYWAGARRAAGRDSETVEATDLADLVEQLYRRESELERVLRGSTILVDAVAISAGQTLTAAAVVDVLPPFAGG